MSPAYLFQGKDEFLMETALAELKHALIADGFEDFDYDLCYSDELPFADILKKLQSPPFGSKKRLVVMKNLKKLLPSDREALFTYLESPNPTTCLVCVAPKDATSDKLATTIEKRANTITFTIWDNQLPAEIETRARAKGLSLEPGAAELIKEMVGDSLFMLNSELDKLKIFLGDGSRVSRDLIAEVSGSSREYLVWDLSQAIGERNRKKALEILCRLQEWEEEPTLIVSACAREFFELLGMKVMPKEPDTGYAPAFISGKKGYFASQTAGRSRGWSRAEIVSRLRQLKAIDLQIKQGRRDPFYLLESFITQHI